MNYLSDVDIFAFSEPEMAVKSWLGQGKSKVLVVYNQPELASEDANFLENILKAVKLSPTEEHTHLLACPPGKRGWPISRICREHDISTVFLLGVPLQQVGLRVQLPAYQFITLAGVAYLWGDDIAVIRSEREQNKNQKAGALWQALKAKFL